LRKGELKLTQYWDLTFPAADQTYARSEDDLADEVRERFRRSVEAQMVSDVPIGAFLSAGLDSSGIVAMMCRAEDQTQPIRTYTITFPNKYRVGETTLDDPEVATRLARHLGCENQRIVVEPDVTDLLPRLVWHMDEPTADPAIITAYLVCREARKQATVLLSGVGGDELVCRIPQARRALLGAGLRTHIPSVARRSAERCPGACPACAALHDEGAEGKTPPGAENGAQRVAQLASIASSETARISTADQKSELYAGLAFIAVEVSAGLILPASTAPHSTASATPTSCTRCFISTPKYSWPA
jgi:asparagine synthetase B (glutamine-hydrolysing)